MFATAFAVICVALGISAGYVVALWRAGFWCPAPSESQPSPNALARLQEIATSASDHVAQHATRVDQIQRELSEAADSDEAREQAVIAALESLQNANERLQTELSQTRRDFEQQSQQLQSKNIEARTDALTRLLNRRAFDDEMRALPETIKSTGSDATFFLLDIDHFKQFNDRYGHATGDRVLQHVAEILRQTLLGTNAVLARYGGEEFVVITSQDSLPMAAQLAEEVRLAVAAAKLAHADLELSITTSIGISHTDCGIDPHDTLARADEALYAAKHAGRNCSYYHNGSRCIPVTELLGTQQSATNPVTEQPTATSESLCSAAADNATQDSTNTSTMTKPESNRNRRKHERKKYTRQHPIAPIICGRLPTPDMFFDATFFDISSGGFGMLLSSPPSSKYFLVALHKAKETMFVTAEVVRMRRSSKSSESSPRMWEVGCRFIGKLAPDQDAQLLLANSR